MDEIGEGELTVSEKRENGRSRRPARIQARPVKRRSRRREVMITATRCGKEKHYTGW